MCVLSTPCWYQDIMYVKVQKPIIKLEQFEGPYDLLLELVWQQKVDVTQISLSQVTDAFLQYVKSGNVEPDLMADFLVVAATLLLLKIRAALPTLTNDEEEEVVELTDRVRMYQLYREQAQIMKENWDRLPLLPANFWGAEVTQPKTTPPSMPVLSALELSELYEDVLQHLPKAPQPTAHLILRGRTLAESLFFHEIVHEASPQDTAVSFLAALEMARQKQVQLHQAKHFDTITIERV
jgi:segregation and condensation protein A